MIELAAHLVDSCNVFLLLDLGQSNLLYHALSFQLE